MGDWAGVRFGWSLSMGPLEHLVREAQLCEEYGFDSVWWMDYQGETEAPAPELFTALTAIGLGTRKISIGSLVTDVLRRHPAVVAHAVASLHQALNGRIILGLGGGGGRSHVPLGIQIDHPVERLREGIEVIKLLWQADAKNPASYQGRSFKLAGARLPIRLNPPYPPIYLAAHGSRMLQLTGELADGWVPEVQSPETYRSMLRSLRQAAEAAGRGPDEIEPAYVAIYSTDPRYEVKLIRAAKYYLAAYPNVLKMLAPDLHHPGMKSHELASRIDLWDQLARRIPDEAAQMVIICGTVDECIEKMEAFMEVGCRHLILEPYWMPHEQVEASIRETGRRIINYFKES